MALLVQNALGHLKGKYKDGNQKGNNVECKYEKHHFTTQELTSTVKKVDFKDLFKFRFFGFLFSCIDVYKEFS